MTFLDQTGLERLWTHIIGRLNDTVQSVNGRTGAVTVREVPLHTANDDGKYLRISNGLATWVDNPEILPVENGGTGYSSIEDTTYVTARYRASSLHSAETTPSTNGIICWIYE